MANLISFLRRDVANPIGHVANQFYHGVQDLASQGENTIGAAGAGIGGLTRVAAGAVTHNPVAEQNALNQTNQAINNRLALNHAFLTAQQAHQGGTALIKPTLSAAGQIAPFALGPELKGATALGSILRPAAAFGGLGAATTAVQGGNRNQIIKSGLTGAAAGGIGGGIGVAARLPGDIAATKGKFAAQAANFISQAAERQKVLDAQTNAGLKGITTAEAGAKFGKDFNAAQSTQKLLNPPKQNFTIPSIENKRVMNGTAALAAQYDKEYKQTLKTFGNSTPKTLSAKVDALDNKYQARHNDLLNQTGEFAPQVGKSPTTKAPVGPKGVPTINPVKAGTPEATARLNSVQQAQKGITRSPLDTKPSDLQAKQAIVPQQSSEGRLTRYTSLENRLSKLGSSGKAALQTIRNQIVSGRIYTQQFRDIAKPFYKLNPEEQTVAIKVLKGGAKTSDTRIQAGADSLRTMFQTIHPLATSKGLKVGNLGPNYFPDTFPKGFLDKQENFNNVVQQMVKDGKASSVEDAVAKVNKIKIEGSTKPHQFGNFKTREANLPNGLENADVVSGYIKGSAKAISEAEHFGTKGELLNKHVADAVAKGQDAGALKGIINSYVSPARAAPGKLTTGLNAYQKGLRVLQLPRAAVSHGPQGLANTASDIGYTKYFKAVKDKIVGGNTEDNHLIQKGGFNADDFGHDSGVTSKATAPGLGPLLRFHTEVAARGGIAVARGLAKNGDEAGLAKIGVDGNFAKNADGSIKLTDEQLIKAGHFEADKSIGANNALQSPAGINTNKGKIFSQYRKLYTFKQAERIAGLFRDAKNGNVAPLARYLAIGVPLSGIAIAAAKNEIKNPGSNPVGSPRKFAGQALYNSGGLAVGYGLGDSLYNGLTHNYGNDSRWSNLAAAVSPGAGFAVQTGQNVAKASHGKPTALQREGLSLIPVGGTKLANTFAPTKPYTPPSDIAKKDNLQTETAFRASKPQGQTLQQVINSKGEKTYAYSLSDGSIATSKDKKTAQTAIQKDTFTQSGQNFQQLGKNVWQLDSNGNPTHTTVPVYQYSVNSATLTSQKDAGDIQGWLSTANKQLQNIQGQLKDPSTSPLKALQLQNDASTLQSNIAKYTGYGGFTKPKSAKSTIASRRSASSKAISSFKVSAAKAPPKPKGVSVRKLAAPSFKAPKTTKLSVSRIPVVSNRRKA